MYIYIRYVLVGQPTRGGVQAADQATHSQAQRGT